jgi:hypothetical protein
MNWRKAAGALLLAAGTVALAVKGFSYTTERHDTKLGPIEFTVKEKDRVEIPTWLGVGLIVVGGALLLVRGKKE